MSSEAISQWVGDVCDLFDQRWQSGCHPKVEDVLPPDAEERGVMVAMLRELLAVDMEYRWRDMFKSLPPGQRDENRKRRGHPWLEDYIRRFPILAKSTSTVLHLLRLEYRARQIWGDRPSLATYLQRFPKLDSSLTVSLHAVLNDLVDTEVRIFQSGKLVLAATARRPISIGRQRSNEPEPMWMDQCDNVDRLVIAPANDREMSRNHCHVELVAVNRLVVVNCSETAEVYLSELIGSLMPGEIHRTCPPISISIGGTVIRVTTTSKVPGLVTEDQENAGQIHDE